MTTPDGPRSGSELAELAAQLDELSRRLTLGMAAATAAIAALHQRLDAVEQALADRGAA